ncbi:hypothetical protein BC831DRAFT_474424 [Entophlyctis helioformis]|nr:hypothetical protein BC831DRAFT_474424 [Entophlyctis helioformis]
MPKIVSRGVISTNDPDSERSGLSIYYCSFCGEYVLVVDTLLDKVPRRKTDGAFVLDKDKREVLRINANPGKTLLVQRAGGFERQERQTCPGCNLVVAYEPNADSPYLYILDGALCLNSKQQSADAAGASSS